MFWRAGEHTVEENVQWAWLRAVEWIVWPIFLSQIYVPILLCIYPWPWVVGATVVVAFIWRNLVATWWTSMAADLGPILVQAKYVVAPVTAFWLWQHHHVWLVAAALLWPWVGPLIAGMILTVPQAAMTLTPLGAMSTVGAVQQRFLNRLAVEATAV